MIPNYLTPDQISIIQEPVPAELIQEIDGHKYVNLMVVVDILNRAFGYSWSFRVLETKREKAVITKPVNNANDAYYVNVLGELSFPAVDPVTKQLIIVTKQAWGGKPVVASNNSKVQCQDTKAAASDALKKCASMIGIASNVYTKDELLVAMQSMDEDVWNSVNQQRLANELNGMRDLKAKVGEQTLETMIEKYCEASGNYSTYGQITPSNIVGFLEYAADVLSSNKTEQPNTKPVAPADDFSGGLFA